MIKVYTTDSCPWCVKAKNYLKSKNIAFEELNVAEDMDARQEMVQKSRQMGVPVLDINGTVVIGFDKLAIDTALTK
ncbi:MAG: glutaredoxin family protein [Clostridium sp.]|uniref:glutaredoxin family protein n=1 Tax=Clostridium sp. TaxID=1506 RepID=UPI0029038B6F|nr:glutaredoxin family protein [Clostridium sp.]MDU1076479.1 glutaredoxin family protein [Clostridium sp.]MDU1126695.1 glutaredoxin family protein [Clostridium sp.]MDU3677980.1 glutaredoxin family protein [Clostridium sp.]MDU6875962.1 glutaredoxin family protein [Clostridium sp.]MDU6937037.1 glutaredoxin family protein [Clostridium sp.]